MNYPDSVRFLYALGNEIRTAKLGLDRIATLLEELDNPQRACKFVHVAGTNGKGSTCAMIASGLIAAGHRTGLFTSPHLVEPTERIQIDGAPVSAAEFSQAFDVVHDAAERLIAHGTLEFHPTYFETVTAMAFVMMREKGIGWCVLEVGLGGRLDATNVVQPHVTAITSIDFDHEAYLGSSLESIASEKAGILKHDVPAIFAPQRPEVLPVLQARAREVCARMIQVSNWQIEDLKLDRRGSQFTARGLMIECPLAGEHQVMNALTATVVLDSIGVPKQAIEDGIRRTRWPGRLERVAEHPEIILDGAHNPAAARALAQYIERFYSDRRVWLIYGTMRDKAIGEVTGALLPVADEVILTAPAQARAASPEALREHLDHPRARVAATLTEAMDMVRAAGPNDAIFITGSLFLVGEARRLLALQ
jgi:dihydrofolate synthase / folylpolyglutamate synthase